MERSRARDPVQVPASPVLLSASLQTQSHTYFQALQEQFHATVVKEHLAVIWGLISDVPEGTPGELHHLITLQGKGQNQSFANAGAWYKPITCFLSGITLDDFKGKKTLLFTFNLSVSGFFV